MEEYMYVRIPLNPLVVLKYLSLDLFSLVNFKALWIVLAVN